MTNRNEPLLTIISPVTLMAGRLNRLSTWLRDIESSDVEVILIHDYRDQATADELIEIIARYKSGLGWNGSKCWAEYRHGSLDSFLG